ncbi:TetR/AcrR family transcriptional regulator [Humibacter antri]
MSDETGNRRGPKRSEQSRMAILSAAFALTLEAGYRSLTIEGIAAKAGVGKQTVYRWWSTKADVLLESLAVKAELRVPIADRGSFRVELAEFLRESFALLAVPGIAVTLRSLMAEAQIDPEFGERFRTGFLERRRVALGQMLERASARGDTPSGMPADIVEDLVFGMIWYRLLATGRPLEAHDSAALLHLLTDERLPAPEIAPAEAELPDHE